MTVSAPTERLTYNSSRLVTLNACFLLVTAIFAVAFTVVELNFSSFLFAYLRTPTAYPDSATEYSLLRSQVVT
jgi:hypothetical protein